MVNNFWKHTLAMNRVCFCAAVFLCGLVYANPFEESASFKAVNEIDALLSSSLSKQGVQPAPLCSDAVFMRRVYLAVLGTLPTAEEAKKFLNDKSATKRTTLIDRLLERPEYAGYWTLKWADLLRCKAEFPVNLWPNGAAVYYRWIHDSIRENKPYNRFARELLLSKGSNFRNGESNFYRAVANRDAESLAEVAALTFMGVQTGPWSSEKQKQMAVFFSRVGYKGTAQWKEEIVFRIRKPLESTDVVFPDGTHGQVKAEQDPRQVFADWLVSPKNKQFNENIANRIWYWLFGNGLVDPPDNFSDENPPVHPALLSYLAEELVREKYDMKHLVRLILNSAAFQQSSFPVKRGSQQRQELFAAYPVRRLDAEVLQDALSQIFGVSAKYVSEVPEPFASLPNHYRTIMIPDTSLTSSFLETFGRATRDSGLVSDRNNGITESQMLFLMNSAEINQWATNFIGQGRNRKNNTGKPNVPREAADEMWLQILSRYPTGEELKTAAEALRSGTPAADIVWALINSTEFLCQH
ncbi:MAG: DUF1549 and DUF1553 domain-containing protein [Planctomycetaceae bacterium]|jgi:hypothetical protein|nr:DUF1549 and DUF1553 domain-containing protein [Planctomycetaceae bacterium]